MVGECYWTRNELIIGDELIYLQAPISGAVCIYYTYYTLSKRNIRRELLETRYQNNTVCTRLLQEVRK